MEHHKCYFHPREVVVGICAFCLNERLLVLASQKELQQQRQHHRSSCHSSHKTRSFAHRRNPINLPKIFALSSLLSRLDLRQRKSGDHYSGSDSCSAPDDSFISIKFGDNGAASWEKSIVPPKVSLEHCNISLKQRLNKQEVDHQRVKAVIEHPKDDHSLRWRKRIGHMFQLIRWKKSSRGNVCHHVGKKLEGVKVRHGWIRTLTKRRTKE